MALKQYKPTTSGRRGASVPTFDEITKKKPEKSLLVPLQKSAGRNAQGRITARHRGGGSKRRYRLIDFDRRKDNVPATVAAIEYDPNRSARIALLYYRDGEKRYIIAPVDLKVGDAVVSGEAVDIRPGNAMPLSGMPLGTVLHNIELSVGKGAQLCRSAGTSAQLMAKEGKYAHVRLPSGEVRMVFLGCRATVGQVGNVEHGNVRLGKAGRVRWRGRRPHVRGVAMNPRDHPHGGGEGRSPIGRKSPVTPWGKPTLGHRTRTRRPSDKFIVRRRGKRG